MSNRYYEFCSGGAWTAKCVNSFWAYMQGLLHPNSNALANYHAAMDQHSSNVSAVAQTVLDSKQGCGDSTNPRVCGWATIFPPDPDVPESGQLYKCLKSNPGCWPQNPGVQQWSFGNIAYVQWLRDSNSAFIVLTINEQEKICTNSKWNLPSSCSLLDIP